jgi:hypothetical protein
MVRRREFNCYKVTTEDKPSGRPDGYNEMNFKLAKYYEDKSYLPMMLGLINPASTINVLRIVFTDGKEARKENVRGDEAIVTLRIVCGLLD